MLIREGYPHCVVLLETFQRSHRRISCAMASGFFDKHCCNILQSCNDCIGSLVRWCKSHWRTPVHFYRLAVVWGKKVSFWAGALTTSGRENKNAALVASVTFTLYVDVGSDIRRNAKGGIFLYSFASGHCERVRYTFDVIKIGNRSGNFENG